MIKNTIGVTPKLQSFIQIHCMANYEIQARNTPKYLVFIFFFFCKSHILKFQQGHQLL